MFLVLPPLSVYFVASESDGSAGLSVALAEHSSGELASEARPKAALASFAPPPSSQLPGQRAHQIRQHISFSYQGPLATCCL